MSAPNGHLYSVLQIVMYIGENRGYSSTLMIIYIEKNLFFISFFQSKQKLVDILLVSANPMKDKRLQVVVQTTCSKT